MPKGNQDWDECGLLVFRERSDVPVGIGRCQLLWPRHLPVGDVNCGPVVFNQYCPSSGSSRSRSAYLRQIVLNDAPGIFEIPLHVSLKRHFD